MLTNFQELYKDRTPKCKYVVNDRKYNIGYLLSDGFYPRWPTFDKGISLPQGPKVRLFVEYQEAVKKEVEITFRVPQSRFAIICGPTRNMDKVELGMIMKACVILHNMIIKDKRDSCDLVFDDDHVEDSIPNPNVQHDHHSFYTAHLCRLIQIRDPERHARLQLNLMQEIWR